MYMKHITPRPHGTKGWFGTLTQAAVMVLLWPGLPAHGQQLERVSHGIGGDPNAPCFSSGAGHQVSADGRFVVYVSAASNLVANDHNGMDDVFWVDRLTGETRFLSRSIWGGQSGNGPSEDASISLDGQSVAFRSFASDLWFGDGNGLPDIFLVQIQGSSQSLTVVTVGTGLDQTNGSSDGPCLSGNGGFVTYFSDAINLVAGDTNNKSDIFVFNRATFATELVSFGPGFGPANGHSFTPAISDDGNLVTWTSFASDHVANDTNGTADVFVFDRSARVLQRASVASSSGAQGNGGSGDAEISGDGNVVGFISGATNLVPGDTNQEPDAFVHLRSTGITERVSVNTSGIQGDGETSDRMSLSFDGLLVAFESGATNFAPTGTDVDVFLRDRKNLRTTLLGVDQNGNALVKGSQNPDLMSDGRAAIFNSINPYGGETDLDFDVFLIHRLTFRTFGAGWPGTLGRIPNLDGTDAFPSGGHTLVLTNGLPSTTGLMWIGFGQTDLYPVFGGAHFYVNLSLPFFVFPIQLAPDGSWIVNGSPVSALLGLNLYCQATLHDPGAVRGVSTTNGLEIRIGVQ